MRITTVERGAVQATVAALVLSILAGAGSMPESGRVDTLHAAPPVASGQSVVRGDYAAGIEAPPVIAQVADDTLKDVAVAVYDPGGSVIYYNPVLMQRFGPLLSAFFMAHESGHIQLHHTRANALLAGQTALDSVLQARELAADCFAARRLVRENPDAVDAAIRFFSQMGPFRYDAAHPSGLQRAERILSCLPNGYPPSPRDARPASTDLRPVEFTVATAPHGGQVPWQVVHYWIAGGIEGTISNLHLPSTVTIRTLPPGVYEYELRVEAYSLDELLQLHPSGPVVGRGAIAVRGGEALQVMLAHGSDSTPVPHLVAVVDSARACAAAPG